MLRTYCQQVWFKNVYLFLSGFNYNCKVCLKTQNSPEVLFPQAGLFNSVFTHSHDWRVNVRSAILIQVVHILNKFCLHCKSNISRCEAESSLREHRHWEIPAGDLYSLSSSTRLMKYGSAGCLEGGRGEDRTRSSS